MKVALDEFNAEALRLLEKSTSQVDLVKVAAALGLNFRNGNCHVEVVRQSPQLGTQIARLRWMFTDGRTPILLMPSSPSEYFELMTFAHSIADAWNLPATIIVEDELAEEILRAPTHLPKTTRAVRAMQRADAQPLWTGLDAEIRRWENLVRGNADQLAITRIDKSPTGESKVDWLVISYGLTAVAAQAAVEQARGQGLGVDHIVLQTLSPLPERAITSAAMGKKFVVVPERNLGQLHPEIQRLCPSLPCVLVSNATAPVRTEQVLVALLKFPRCC